MALGQSLLNNTLGLSIFAVLTAGIIAVTQSETATRISENELAARSRALFEIMPQALHDNVLLNDTIPLHHASLVGKGGSGEINVAMKDGEVAGFIFPAIAPDGYSGPIKSIVGIDRNGVITGVRVLNHQETPGLGDKIELKKSDWVLQFNGRSFDNPETIDWKVDKDGGAFDSLTGATITPRAVVGSVQRALEYFALNQEQLLAFQPKAVAEALPDGQQLNETTE